MKASVPWLGDFMLKHTVWPFLILLGSLTLVTTVPLSAATTAQQEKDIKPSYTSDIDFDSQDRTLITSGFPR
jgi:hypothetical protein